MKPIQILLGIRTEAIKNVPHPTEAPTNGSPLQRTPWVAAEATK